MMIIVMIIVIRMIVIKIIITTTIIITIIITYIMHIMHTYYRGFFCYPASCTYLIRRGTCMHACIGYVNCGILSLFDDVLGLF